MLVNGAGLPGQLKKMCPGITELDVSRNFLNSWESTAEIAVQLEQLENLTVRNVCFSENVLPVPHNPEALQDHFKALKYVVAAKMGYDWHQILQCTTMWQKLEMLKVCFIVSSQLNYHCKN
ncbi:hypothetical protein PR048_003718 [Dryococelus australis]|uniref:Uncharacterized protein n=1 Tax=Dryococelus australis TaxID=614101 RepID=A0ABQ9IQK5_9NEOP|nr:hypothetical protein PR048_003718 [Dryococelus australis]